MHSILVNAKHKVVYQNIISSDLITLHGLDVFDIYSYQSIRSKYIHYWCLCSNPLREDKAYLWWVVHRLFQSHPFFRNPLIWNFKIFMLSYQYASFGLFSRIIYLTLLQSSASVSDTTTCSLIRIVKVYHSTSISKILEFGTSFNDIYNLGIQHKTSPYWPSKASWTCVGLDTRMRPNNSSSRHNLVQTISDTPHIFSVWSLHLMMIPLSHFPRFLLLSILFFCL